MNVIKNYILFVLFACISLTMDAQAFKAPSHKAFTDTTTTFTYEVSNNVYKVYKSKSGAFYIWRTSKKTGRLYKSYLPKEVQIQMGRKYTK